MEKGSSKSHGKNINAMNAAVRDQNQHASVAPRTDPRVIFNVSTVLAVD